MQELLDAVGGWKIVGAAGVVVIALLALSRVFKKKPTLDAHTQKRKCKNCGWFGQVSAHAPKCPKCGVSF